MNSLPQPSVIAAHSAMTLFRGIRDVILLKKLSGDTGEKLFCMNKELYVRLNPELAGYFLTHPESMQVVLSAWCAAHRNHMRLLDEPDGAGFVVANFVLYHGRPNAIGDRWQLTTRSIELISNLKTNDAVDDFVAFALRSLEHEM